MSTFTNIDVDKYSVIYIGHNNMHTWQLLHVQSYTLATTTYIHGNYCMFSHIHWPQPHTYMATIACSVIYTGHNNMHTWQLLHVQSYTLATTTCIHGNYCMFSHIHWPQPHAYMATIACSVICTGHNN